MCLDAINVNNKILEISGQCGDVAASVRPNLIVKIVFSR